MHQRKKLLLFLLFWRCQIIPPELEWEDVEEEHEPTLNVMALLSTDSLLTSFVRVHKTLGMDEATDTLVRDTIDGEIYIDYVSRFVVRDANVVLTSGLKEYKLNFVKQDYTAEERWERDSERYVYEGDDLTPLPGEQWTLSISTPSGLQATGQTTIPPNPKLDQVQLPDSFDINRSMEIVWAEQKNHHQVVNVNNGLSYYFYADDYSDMDSYGGCGFWREHIINPGEKSWTYRREICEDGFGLGGDGEAEDVLMVHLMSMDSNYYNYFIKFASDSEFNSLFLGQGGSGRSFGIGKGIGVFASIGIDRYWIPIVR